MLDRWVGDGMMLMVGRRTSNPLHVQANGLGALGEIGVLPAVSGVGLAEAADRGPRRGADGERE